MLPLKVAGLGLYFPEQRETKTDFINRGIPVETIEKLGVYERRLMGKNQSGSDMELEAARIALNNGHFNPIDIDLIISFSNLPQMIGMPNSNLLQSRLGAKNAAAFDIVQSCCSVIPSMVVAANFVALGQYERVLVTAATNWSVGSDPSQPSADFVLGDGAAAVVLTRSAPGYGILSYDMQTDGSFYYNCGSCVGHDKKSKYYEAHSDKMFFYIDDSAVHGSGSRFAKHILTSAPSTFKAALKKAALSPEDINCALIHGSIKPIANGWIKGMKVPADRFPLTYDRYGNISAVTILANLKEGLDKGMIKHGDTVAFVSQGAGFSAGSIIMKWS